MDFEKIADRLRVALGLPEGQTTFPWQTALLRRFLEGSLPTALDVPTGLGKTAVMAIWLVARAAGAPVPRRLVYVVDRRAVVDQATAVAESLRDFVKSDEGVSQALGLEAGRQLPISTLRGQFVDNKEWLEDPSAAAIVLGTVDMVGSRLLFSGYGVSRKMRPYHAGLLGADALIALDEAHLVPPFEKLIAQIAGGADADGRSLRAAGKRDALIPPLKVLSLSATGRGRNTEDVVRLTDSDRQHHIARRRLSAQKRLVLREEVPEKELPEKLAAEAWGLSGDGTKPVRVVVFCTSRDHAQHVVVELQTLARKAGLDIATDLFVGGRRVYERALAAEWLREHGFIAGRDSELIRPAFVIATAAGEVGVDFDANHAVCDVVAWERMIQRFGRVNRRGDTEAQITVLPVAHNAKTQEALQKYARWRQWLEEAVKVVTDGTPVNGDEGGSVEGESDDEEGEGKIPKIKLDERRLAERALRQDATRELIGCLRLVAEGHDASPDGLLEFRERARKEAKLSELVQRATTPEPLHPPLVRPLVEAWSMTSLEQHTGRPEVTPWVRGWLDEDEAPQTTVVWRTFLPITDAGDLVGKQDLDAFRDAAAPHMVEQLETETWRVVEWLGARTKGLNDLARDDERDRLDRPLSKADPIAIFDSPDGRTRIVRCAHLAKERRTELERALSGAILIVDRRIRGLSQGLLSAESDQEVIDVSELDPPEESGARPVPFRVRRVLEEPASLSEVRWRKEAAIPLKLSDDGADEWLVLESLVGRSAESEEGRSGARNPQLLEEHQDWAEIEAKRIAARLALPSDLAQVLTIAARLHDEGKRAERWQRAFNAPGDSPYAKTTSRPDLKLLDGYRHELGSLPYAELDERVKLLDPELRELCLHLIVTHHGYARPLIRTTGATEPPTRLIERAQEIAQRFAALEQRWGPWGLAWLEALLRSADQQASRRNDMKASSHG